MYIFNVIIFFVCVTIMNFLIFVYRIQPINENMPSSTLKLFARETAKSVISEALVNATELRLRHKSGTENLLAFSTISTSIS